MHRPADPTQNSKIVVHAEADLEALIPGFLGRRREDIRAVLAALVRSDYETIGRLGHSMKGTGASYGFDYITELGSSIEAAAEGKRWRAILDLVGELSCYLERVEVVYE